MSGDDRAMGFFQIQPTVTWSSDISNRIGLLVAEVTCFTADMSGPSGKSTTTTTTMAPFHSGISVSHDRVSTNMGNKTRSLKLKELEFSLFSCHTIIKIVLCSHLAVFQSLQWKYHSMDSLISFSRSKFTLVLLCSFVTSVNCNRGTI